MMASGISNTGISRENDEPRVYKAWKKIELRTKYRDCEKTIDVTEESLRIKLQFAVVSEKERRSVLFRLKEKMSLDCSDHQLGIVNITLHTQMQENEIKDVLTYELSDKEFCHLDFESEQTFNTFLTSVADLIKDDTVGVLITSTDKTVAVNVVGSDRDLQAVRKEFERCTYRRSLIEIPHHYTYEQEKNLHAVDVKLDIDTVQFLYWMKFRVHLQAQCPTADYRDHDSDNSRMVILDDDKRNVEKAYAVLNAYLSDVVKKDIDLPDTDLEFLKIDNVYLHVQKKLWAVGTYLQISDHAKLWSFHKNNFEEAEKIVSGSYSFHTAQSNFAQTEEVESVIKESRNKIIVFHDQDRTYKIMYLKEVEELAAKVKRILETGTDKGMKIPCPDFVIRYALSTGIHDQLEEAFPHLKVKFCTQTNIVDIIGEKKDVEDAVKEFKACIKDITRVEIKGLCKGIEELLVRKHVSDYVAETFKTKPLLFMKEGAGLTCVGLRLDKETNLKERLENECFSSINVQNAYLETESGKQFIKEHSDSLFVMHGSESKFCFTKAKEPFVKESLKYCNTFSKKCPSFVSDFLKTHGKAIVKEIEDKNSVNIVFENENIIANGNDKDGQLAIRELHKKVPVCDLFFNDEKYSELLNSETVQKKLSSIAERQKCCWRKTCQTDDKDGELAKMIKNGVNHVASWIPLREKCTVSVVEADFNSCDLDVVIVPVDDKLCGENIFKGDGSVEDYKSHFNLQRTHTLELRDYDKCAFRSKGREKFQELVFLGCSRSYMSKSKQLIETIKGDALQNALGEICTPRLQKQMQSIGFALPCDTEDTSLYVADVIEGFLKVEQHNGGQLYICVKDDARSTVEAANDFFSKKKGTRRILSDKAEGIFKKPTTSVKVTEKSFLDVGAECLVVAVAQDLDLSKGYLSQLVDKEAGGMLQEQVKSKARFLSPGEIIVVTSVGNLCRRGVKALIFGCLPKWKKIKNCLKILQMFVTDCLISAEENNCKSIAFPALGTGKLEYPPLDVAKVMMDGVERHIAQSIHLRLDVVFISAPVMEGNDEVLQILQREQQNRSKEHSTDGMKPVTTTEDDAHILTASSSTMNYTVTTETFLQGKFFGIYVDVHFLTEPKKGKKEMVEWFANPWCQQYTCLNSKKSLEEAVTKMVKFCENKSITSVYIHCSTNFQFSFGEQTEILLKAIEEESDTYKYLTNVTVLTPDKTGLSNIEDYFRIQEQPSKKTRSTALDWKKERIQKPKCSVHVKLIGATKSGVKAVEEEFKKYLDAAKKGVVGEAEFRENVDATKKGVEAEEKFSENLLTTADRQKANALKKQTDEVSAEVNPGIVKYLKSKQDFTITWKKSVKQAFDVEIAEHNSADGLKMIVTGSFESILKIERYLERDFPELPKENLSENVLFTEEHFGADAEETLVAIPVDLSRKVILLELFSEEIQSIIDSNVISSLNPSKDDNLITMKCKKEKEEFVKTKFYFFKHKLEQLVVRNVSFDSDSDFACARLVCKTQRPKQTVTQMDEEKKIITIFALKEQDVAFLERTIKSRRVFKFNSVFVSIYKCDILEAKVEYIVSASNKSLSNTKGVSKCIAEKAGSRYKDECQKSVRENGPLQISECRVFGPGTLKFKKILNVNCMLEQSSYSFDNLAKIKEAIINCLCIADNLGASSIAIPFICSGSVGFEIQKCAQEYVRALKVCSDKLKTVKEVHFLDVDEGNVHEVCQVFGNVDNEDDYQIHPNKVFTLQSKVKIEVHLYCARMQLESIDSEGAVILNVLGSQEIYDGHFKEMMMKAKREQQSYLDLPSSGRKKCKCVILAEQPKWSVAGDTFKRDTHFMMDNILKAVSEKCIPTLAFPISASDMGLQATELYCHVIADDIFNFISTKPKDIYLEKISLYFDDKKVFEKMVKVIGQKCEERKKGHGAVASSLETIV